MSSRSDRVLYIDGPKPPMYNVVMCQNISDMRDLLEEASYLNREPLSIDMRGCVCKSAVFGGILKLLDDYEGPVELLCEEPVPPTILSRFSTILCVNLQQNRCDVVETIFYDNTNGLKTKGLLDALFLGGKDGQNSDESTMPEMLR